MSDGKNIRITNETFVKLENIKSDARSNGKRLSLGAIVDDLVSFRDKLPYASCGKAFGEEFAIKNENIQPETISQAG